jgi:hypothetical protein
MLLLLVPPLYLFPLPFQFLQLVLQLHPFTLLLFFSSLQLVDLAHNLGELLVLFHPSFPFPFPDLIFPFLDNLPFVLDGIKLQFHFFKHPL